MAVFVPKKYACVSCGHKGKILLAYRSVEDIIHSTVNTSWPSEVLQPSAIYEQKLLRVSDDLPPVKQVIKSVCEKCASEHIAYLVPDNESNVLNFYPVTTAEKYLAGFDKQLPSTGN